MLICLVLTRISNHLTSTDLQEQAPLVGFHIRNKLLLQNALLRDHKFTLLLLQGAAIFVTAHPRFPVLCETESPEEMSPLLCVPQLLLHTCISSGAD